MNQRINRVCVRHLMPQGIAGLPWKTVLLNRSPSRAGGNTEQHFAARHAAANLSQLPGWVTGLGPGKLPATSRVGPGAEAGHWLGEAAENSDVREK